MMTAVERNLSEAKALRDDFSSQVQRVEEIVGDVQETLEGRVTDVQKSKRSNEVGGCSCLNKPPIARTA